VENRLFYHLHTFSYFHKRRRKPKLWHKFTLGTSRDSIKLICHLYESEENFYYITTSLLFVLVKRSFKRGGGGGGAGGGGGGHLPS